MILKATCPSHERKCQVCGEVMVWLPQTDRFGCTYGWRAWCIDHGHATRRIAVEQEAKD